MSATDLTKEELGRLWWLVDRSDPRFGGGQLFAQYPEDYVLARKGMVTLTPEGNTIGQVITVTHAGIEAVTA